MIGFIIGKGIGGYCHVSGTAYRARTNVLPFATRWQDGLWGGARCNGAALVFLKGSSGAGAAAAGACAARRQDGSRAVAGDDDLAIGGANLRLEHDRLVSHHTHL